VGWGRGQCAHACVYVWDGWGVAAGMGVYVGVGLSASVRARACMRVCAFACERVNMDVNVAASSPPHACVHATAPTHASAPALTPSLPWPRILS